MLPYIIPVGRFVRTYTTLVWRNEWFRLARRFQYTVQESNLNIKASGIVERTQLRLAPKDIKNKSNLRAT